MLYLDPLKFLMNYHNTKSMNQTYSRAKQIIISLVFLAICIQNAHSQDTYISRSISDLMTDIKWSKRESGLTAIIEGSPFLSENFQEGVVFFDGKFKVDHLPLRFNLYTGEMEFMNKNNVLAIADPEKVDRVIIGSEVFIYIVKEEKSPLSGFVKMWNTELPSVVTKMKVDYFDKEPPQPIVESKPARYERANDDHFLLLTNGQNYRITSVKKLIEYLGSHEKELSDYARKEKVSANKPSEMVAMVDYFKSLK